MVKKLVVVLAICSFLGIAWAAEREGGQSDTLPVQMYGKYNGAATGVMVNADGSLPINDTVISGTGISKSIDYTASMAGSGVWIPATGKKFVITDMIISGSSAGMVSVIDGTGADMGSRILKATLAANGGAVVNYSKPRESQSANYSVVIITGTGAVGSATFYGYEK